MMHIREPGGSYGGLQLATILRRELHRALIKRTNGGRWTMKGGCVSPCALSFLLFPDQFPGSPVHFPVGRNTYIHTFLAQNHHERAS